MVDEEQTQEQAEEQTADNTEQQTEEQPTAEEEAPKPKNMVTIEEAGPCKKKVSIEIPEEAIKMATDEQYKTLRKEALLPGFRKGRAPRRLLEKRFGNLDCPVPFGYPRSPGQDNSSGTIFISDQFKRLTDLRGFVR